MDIRRYDYVFRTIPPCATVQCCTQAFSLMENIRCQTKNTGSIPVVSVFTKMKGCD